MDEEAVRASLLAISQAFKDGYTGPFKAFMSQQTYWEIPGTSPFSGRYSGPEECEHMVSRRRDASDPALELFGEDLAVSPYHGVLMFAVRGFKNQRIHLSHEIVVAAYGAQSLEAIHHYIYHLDRFDAFWS